MLTTDIIWVSLGFPKPKNSINTPCNEIDTSINFVGVGQFLAVSRYTKESS